LSIRIFKNLNRRTFWCEYPIMFQVAITLNITRHRFRVSFARLTRTHLIRSDNRKNLSTPSFCNFSSSQSRLKLGKINRHNVAETRTVYKQGFVLVAEAEVDLATMLATDSVSRPDP